MCFDCGRCRSDELSRTWVGELLEVSIRSIFYFLESFQSLRKREQKRRNLFPTGVLLFCAICWRGWYFFLFLHSVFLNFCFISLVSQCSIITASASIWLSSGYQRVVFWLLCVCKYLRRRARYFFFVGLRSALITSLLVHGQETGNDYFYLNNVLTCLLLCWEQRMSRAVMVGISLRVVRMQGMNDLQIVTCYVNISTTKISARQRYM